MWSSFFPKENLIHPQYTRKKEIPKIKLHNAENAL